MKPLLRYAAALCPRTHRPSTHSYVPLTVHTSVCCLFRAYFRPQAAVGARGGGAEATAAGAADLGRVLSRRSRARTLRWPVRVVFSSCAAVCRGSACERICMCKCSYVYRACLCEACDGSRPVSWSQGVMGVVLRPREMLWSAIWASDVRNSVTLTMYHQLVRKKLTLWRFNLGNIISKPMF